MNDQELLEQFRAGRKPASQQAFSHLVARHVDWVYSAVLRQVRDPHLADDVTQTVFIVLAKKAASLRGPKPLTAWLFKVARYASLEALRAERRRKHHENKAMTMAQTTIPAPAVADEHGDEPAWETVRPFLDELVSRLESVDRHCVLLRFYQRKSFPEIGAELGMSEEAARKRVDRAVQTLRARFRRRGVTTSTAALAFALSKHASHAAAPSAVALCSAPATAAASVLANATLAAMAVARVKLLGGAVAAAVLAALAAGALIAQIVNPGTAPRTSGSTMPAQVAPVLTNASSRAAGWPATLPGAITSTPSAADLDADGTPEVVVTVMARDGDPPYAHPNPQRAARVYALRADGSMLPGFPVEVVTEAEGEERTRRRYYVGDWSSSPSVCYGADGKTPRLVVTTPYFLGLRVIDAHGSMRRHRGGSQWANVPLADLGGDNDCEIVTGAGLMTLSGEPVPDWPGKHPIATRSGFAPCVGDADGDGKPEIYHLFAATSSTRLFFSNQSGTIVTEVGGFDHTGKPLPGWPKKVDNPHWCPPVLGDIAGDENLEVVAAYGHLFAWTHDGKGVEGTRAEKELDGILKDGGNFALAPPTLADLDGDGKAEIIVYDQARRAVRAWRGNGTPVGADADGILATLEIPQPHSQSASRRYNTPWAGVSAADLGADGVMDLLCGVYWIRFDPATKQATVERMLPEPAHMGGTQPTIMDLGGDGQAEVVLGLSDGRVCVYRTGLRYVPDRVHWPTVNGNFQHTGVATGARRGAAAGEGR